MGERQSSSTSSTQLIKPNYHMVALGLFYQDSWYSVAGIDKCLTLLNSLSSLCHPTQMPCSHKGRQFTLTLPLSTQEYK